MLCPLKPFIQKLTNVVKTDTNKTNEVLVNNLFLFRRFDDHGHHYHWSSKEITQKLNK